MECWLPAAGNLGSCDTGTWIPDIRGAEREQRKRKDWREKEKERGGEREGERGREKEREREKGGRFFSKIPLT